MTEQQQAAMAAAEKALEGAKTAIWDKHYGDGLSVAYARAIGSECEAALQLLKAAGDGWEPVGEKHKDGELFDLWCDLKREEGQTPIRVRMTDFVWDDAYEDWNRIEHDGNGYCLGDGGPSFAPMTATHAMPLPLPPQTGGE